MDQDWTPVVLSKATKQKVTGLSSAQPAAVQKPSGSIKSEEKPGAAENKSAHTSSGLGLKKLEDSTEEFKHDTVNQNLSKAISTARLAKKITQEELATLINEKPQIIQEYESGKAIPNPQILNKLDRALGRRIPRTAVELEDFFSKLTKRKTLVAFARSPPAIDINATAREASFVGAKGGGEQTVQTSRIIDRYTERGAHPSIIEALKEAISSGAGVLQDNGTRLVPVYEHRRGDKGGALLEFLKSRFPVVTATQICEELLQSTDQKRVDPKLITQHFFSYFELLKLYFHCSYRGALSAKDNGAAVWTWTSYHDTNNALFGLFRYESALSESLPPDPLGIGPFLLLLERSGGYYIPMDQGTLVDSGPEWDVYDINPFTTLITIELYD